MTRIWGYPNESGALMDWDLVAREVLRALRGERSQVAFSRRLGYRSNVAADWEGGRRFPNAARTLAAAARVGVDVLAAMDAFHPRTAAAWRTGGLPAWLVALQGSTPRRDVAGRAGCTVPQVGRWLRGEADPPLPQLLALLDAMTGRAGDWVDALIGVERVPSLAEAVRNRTAVLRLVYQEPWAAAVLAALSTVRGDDPDGQVAAMLGLSTEKVARLIEVMVRGGAVVRSGDGLQVVGLTVDVPPVADDIVRVRRHWVGVSLDRLAAPAEGDRFSFNVCAVSRADLARIVELQSLYFRELRSIVAASSPAEVVALITMHTLGWAAEPEPAS